MNMRKTISIAAGVMALAVLGGRPAVAAEPPAKPAAVIRYELKEESQVSLAIYDAQGRQVRTLLYGVPQAAGTHTLSWDGVDRAGAPVPAGEYRWRLLATPGFQATYLTTIGTNPGTHSYDPWFGNHSGPQVVAMTGTGVVVGGSGENTASYLCTSLDGKQIPWRLGQHMVAAWPASIAGGKDTVIDLALAIWGESRQARVYILDARTGAERSPSFDVLVKGDTAPDYRMDANDRDIAVSYAKHNELRWYDYKGALQTTLPMPAPGDLAIDASGTCYVLSEGQLLAVGRTGAPRVVIAKKDLTEPVRVALDRGAGKLWIAESGASQQIKRFTLDGKLEKPYGRAGGRAYGDYEGRDFRSITDLCPDGAGGVLVTEGPGSLCRLVHIGAAGEVLREWFGPQQFYNFTFLDPRRPDEAWFYGGYEDAAVAKIDWQTGAWRVIRTFHYPTCDGLFPVGPTSVAERYIPRRVGDRLFLVSEGNAGPAVLRVDEAAGRLIPVAAARRQRGGPGPLAWKAALQAAGLKADANPAFTWTDRNGDGDFQAEEFSIGGSLPGPGFWSQAVMMADGGLTLPTSGEVPWNEVANLGTADLPRWDLTQLRPSSARYPADMRHFLGSASPMGSYVDAARNTYLLAVGNCEHNADRHEGGWPSDYQGTSRFVKWDKAGKVMWSVGSQAVPHSAGDPAAAPAIRGEFCRPVRIVAEVKDCLVVAEQAVRPATAWTKDGLYAGNFLDRRADDGLPGQYYHWFQDPVTKVEGPIPYDCLQGGSVSTLADGRVVWMPMGNHNTPVYAISGWDGWVRKDGVLKIVTEAAPITAGTGLKAMYYASEDLSGEPVAVATDARLWFAANADPATRARSWQKTPVPGLAAGADFSARWSGYLRAPFSEDYRFRVRSDAASRYRVWLDGALICDTWQAAGSPAVTESVVVPLRAGQYYPLEVEYTHRGADPVFSLVWDSPTLDRQRIPTEYLYPYDGRAGSGLRADYQSEQGAVFTCIDPGVAFDARTTAANAVRWSGTLLPTHATGEAAYTFSVEGTGAARLLIDDRVVLDASQLDGVATAKPVTLSAGMPARLILTYSGAAQPAIRLNWAIDAAKPEPVPLRQLLPAIIVSGRGLTAEYFSDEALTSIVAANEIGAVDLTWSKQRIPSLPGVKVAGVALHGALMPLHATGLQRYTLRVQASGAAELLLDGKAVPLKAGKHGVVNATAAFDLLAGRAVPLVLRYRAAGDAAALRLLWSSKGLPEALVPARCLHPSPSPLAEDLLAGLPSSGALAAGVAGWRCEIAADQPGWTSQLLLNGGTPALHLGFGRPGTVKLTRPLASAGQNLSSWFCTMRLDYTGCYFNHGGEGQFLRILDRQGRAIIQVNPQQVRWPEDQQIQFNGAMVARFNGGDFLNGRLPSVWDLRIAVQDGAATITLGDFPALTTPLADKDADWRNPASLQLVFTQGGAVYNRVIGLIGPRFFGSR